MRVPRRLLVLAAAPVVAVLGIATPSFASNGTTPPGYSVANGQTVCAAHGSFGAFGKGFNFGNSTSGHVPYPGNAQNGNGADGPGTGANNATLCGNPQGNP
jgi:hypothetical protein